MGNGEKVGEGMEGEVEKVKIEGNIVWMEWGSYLEKVGDGEGGMFMVGWSGDKGEGDKLVYGVLDKDSMGWKNY